MKKKKKNTIIQRRQIYLRTEQEGKKKGNET